MIVLTHFGTGNRIALNIDLIEKVEETPDTVITLVNGTRYLVQESLEQILGLTAAARAKVIQLSQTLPDPGEVQKLRLVKGEGEVVPGDDHDGGDGDGPQMGQQ